MKSPFPGMDPFIENQKWSDFHGALIHALRQYLLDNLPPELEVESESTFSASDLILGARSNLSPDVSVAEAPQDDVLREPIAPYGNATSPTTVVKLTPEEVGRQRTVVIKRREGKELVAAIEVLSPANKRQPNLKVYREKRTTYLRGGVHLLELDLLRAGTPPFILVDWPTDPYRIQLVNAFTAECVLWSVPLLQSLPTVFLPLLNGMEPIYINIQEMFEQVYAASRYRRSLVYDAERLRPVLSASEQNTVASLLEE